MRFSITAIHFLGAIIVATLFNVAMMGQAQETQRSETTGTAQQLVPDKALKYHAALQKRPTPGYLFDRLYNAWLDTSSIDSLEKFLTNQVDKNSQTADRLLLAFFYSKQNEDVKALQQFRTALEKDPGNADVLYEKGVVEARTLDFETALADLKNAAASKPSTESAIKIGKLQGKLYLRNRQNEEAITVWKKLLTENPADDELLEDVIEIEISEGLFDEALEHSDLLIKRTREPFQKVARQLRKGDIFQRAGKRDKALKIYDTTLSSVGSDTWLEREILAQIEQIFRREDDLTGLKEHYEKLIAKNSQRIALRKNSAKLFLDLGDTDSAIKTYREILQLTPGDRSNQETFIDMLAGAEQRPAAIEQTRTLIGQFPDDAELQIKLAQLQHDNADADAAANAIDQYLVVTERVAEKTEYAFLRAARMLVAFEQMDRAEAIFQRCIDTFPDSSSAKEATAEFLFKANKKEPATAIWKQLIASGSATDVVRVSRAIAARQEHQLAFDLLQSRYADFKTDSQFLGVLCAEAITLKRWADAVPWARQRVELASSNSDLESSLPTAIQIIISANQTDATIAELSSNSNLGVPLMCLLTELMEKNGLQLEADKKLREALLNFRNENNNDQLNANQQMLANQQIRLYSQRMDWSAAAAATQRMIEMPGGQRSTNLRRLVELYVRDGQLENALTSIEQWKRISPGSLQPWFSESEILAQLGRTDESVNTLRIAAQTFPDDPDLFGKLAARYIDNGQYKDAERIYWRQYEESEKLTDKLRWIEQLARLTGDNGEVGEVVTLLKERQKNNPQSIEPLLALAQVHRINDDYEERRAALLEATRLQPNSVELLLEVARMEESEGEWEKAIATLKQAATIDTQTTRAAEQMAKIYLKYGEPEKGFAILLDVAGGANSNPRDIEAIADAIISTEDWPQAETFLLSQIARFPDDYRLQYQLAVACEALDKTDLAIEMYLELLVAEAELPGVKTTQSVNPYYNQIDEMTAVLPQSTVEFVELAMLTDSVYAYQQNNQRYPMNFGSSFVVAGTLQLPDDLKAARQFAMIHLLRIAESLDEDKRQSLISQMELQRVPNAKVLIEFGREMDSAFSVDSETVERFPGNRDVLALAVMASVSGSSDEPLELDTLKLAVTEFQDDKPDLSFIAALSAANRDADSGPLLDEALKRLGSDSQPNYMLVMAIAETLSGGFNGNEITSELSKERIALLNQRLIEWYPSLQTSSAGYNEWAIMLVLRALQQSDDPAKYIKFLDDEVVRARSSKNQQSAMTMQMMYGYGYGGTESLIELPAFPPKQFAEFPSSVLSVLALSTDEDTYDPFSALDENSETEWHEKYGASIDAATDPMLRTLLRLKSAVSAYAIDGEPEGEKYPEVKAELKTMLAAERPSLDAFLLAASLATHERNFARAAELLDTARNLPMTQAMRQQVDSNLVALATQGLAVGLEDAENAKVVTAAKDAALRLRRIRLRPEQRGELLLVMENLGLNEEAKKMEEKEANSNIAGAIAGMFGGRTPASSGDRVRDLIDSGKQDAAIRLLAQDFKAQARNQMDIQQYSPNDYELGELKTKVKAYGVTSELLEYLTESGGDTKNGLSTVAFANELLDEPKRAMELYQKLLSDHPTEDGLRLRLMMLEVKSEPAAMGKHLEKFDAKNWPFVGGALTQALHGDFDFGQKMQIVDQVNAYLDSLIENKSATDKLDLHWVSAVLEAIAAKMDLLSDSPENDWTISAANFPGTINRYNDRPVSSDDSTSIPSLYESKIATAETPASADDETRTEKNKITEEAKQAAEAIKAKLATAAEKRRTTFDALCSRMAQIPELATDAFTAKLAATEANLEPINKELIDAALAAIQKQADLSQPNGGHSHAMPYQMMQNFNGYYDDDSEAQVTRRTPVEFLARHFGLQRPESAAIEMKELATAMRTAKQESSAKQFEQLLQLYSVAGDQFVATAKELLPPQSGSSRRPAANEFSLTMDKVVEVWADRDDQVPLADFVLERLQGEKLDPNYGNSENVMFVYAFLKKLATGNEAQAVENFLARYSVQLLGPRNEQFELIKQNYNPERPSRNKVARQVMGYVQLLNIMLDETELVFPAIIEAKTLGLNEPLNQAQYRLRRAMQTKGNQSPEQLLEWLNRSSFLKPLPEFDPILVENDSDSPTIFGGMLGNLHYIDSDSKKKLAQYLAAQQETSFGEKLLLGLVQDNNSRPNPNLLTQLLGENLLEFNALDDQQKLAIAMLNQQIGNALGGRYGTSARTQDELSPDAQQVATVLSRLTGKSAAKDLEKLMAAKRISDLEIESHQFDDWSQQLLLNLDHSDSKLVVDAYFQSVKLINGDRNNNRNNYFGDGTSFASRLLSQINLRQANYQSLLISTDILNRPGEDIIEMNENERSPFASFFNREIAAVKTKLSSDKTIPKNRLMVRVLESVLQNIAREANDRDLSVWLPCFAQTLESLDSTDQSSIIKWLELEASGGKHSQLANEWLNAAKLVSASREIAKLQQPQQGNEDSDSADEEAVNNSSDEENEAAVKIQRLTEPADYQQHFITRINDGNRTISARLPLAKKILEDPTLPAESVWAAASLLTSTENKNSPSFQTMRIILESVLSLPRDEAWKDQATELATNWKKHFLVSKERNYSSSNDRLMLQQAVELFVALEQTDSINQMLRKYESNFSTDPTLLVTLIRNQFHVPASKLVQRAFANPEQFQELDFEGAEELFYDKKLHDALPEFLAAGGNPTGKFLAEALLVNLPDTKKAADVAPVKREDRLSALVERFSTMEFKLKSHHEIALLLLADAPNAKEVLLQPLTDIAAKIRFTDLYAENSYGQEFAHKQALAITHVCLALRNGDDEPLTKLLTTLRENQPKNRDYQFSQLIDLFAGKIEPVLSEQISQADEARQTKLLTLMRELGTPTGESYYSRSTLQAAVFLAHLSAGRLEDYKKWVEAIPTSKREDFFGPDVDEIWPKVSKLLKAKQQTELEPRLSAVKELWSLIEPLKMSVGSGHYQDGISETCSSCSKSMMGLNAVKKSGLLTEAELLDHGAELAELASVKGEVWRQVAQYQIAAKQYEPAAEALKKSIAAATEEMQQAKTNRTIELAWCLKQLNRADEISALLSGIDEGLIFDSNLVRFSELKSGS